MEVVKDRKNRKTTSTFLDSLLPAKKAKVENDLPLADIISNLKFERFVDTPLEESFDDDNAQEEGDDQAIDDELCFDQGALGVDEANGNSTYFTCSHCNKFFWSEASLKHHSSLYHSEKSFVCEICGKAFRFRSNLAEHRSVHTSLKPYVCKYCGKSSRLKGNLTKHILKHHKKEQNAYIGKDDIIIRKGKKSVKDPAAVDFLEKSMIVLSPDNVAVNSASAQLYNMAKTSEKNCESKRKSTTKPSANDAAKSLSSISAALATVHEVIDANYNNRPTSIDDRRSSVSKSNNSAPDDSSMLPVENSFEQLFDQPNTATPDTLNPTFQLNFEHLLSNSIVESHKLRLKPDPSPTNHLRSSMRSPPSSSAAAPVNTKCVHCGKHFRKSANLALHIATKHAASAAPSSPESEMQDAGMQDSSTPQQALPISAADFLLPNILLKSLDMSAFPTSPPPLKLGNRNALMNGGNATLGSLLMNDPLAALTSATSLKDNSANGNNAGSTGGSCLTKDLKEIKTILEELKRGVPEVGKVESVLSSVDSRVSRLEKQVELSLATLYSLVQMQCEMNSAFVQFKTDVLEQLKSLQNTVKTKEDLKPLNKKF